MPRPTLAQLVIGGSIIALAAILAAVPIALREVTRSRASALASRIDRATRDLEASPDWEPPAPCVAPAPSAWRLPSPLRRRLHRNAVPAPVLRYLQGDLPAGHPPDEAAVALAASLRLDEVPWSTMACGRGEEPPLDFDLELLLMLRFAELASAGGEPCLSGAREVLHAGHAQAAWADAWGNDSDAYVAGIAPAHWLTAGVLRCARDATSQAAASLAHELATNAHPPPPPRLVARWRSGQARSYVERITHELDTSWSFPLSRDPEIMFEYAARHVAVIELGARIRADALPAVVAALDDPALADGPGSPARGLIERYLLAVARLRMLALALSAIAGDPLEEPLRDPNLEDPFTGRPFEWDGERLASPGIRTQGGAVAPIELRIPR